MRGELYIMRRGTVIRYHGGCSGYTNNGIYNNVICNVIVKRYGSRNAAMADEKKCQYEIYIDKHS